MAGSGLMFKLPIGMPRTNLYTSITSANLALPEHECGTTVYGKEKSVLGGSLVGRRWAALVLPIACSVAALPSTPAIAIDRSQGCQVELRTQNGCGLGVAHFPDFVYNAEGGGGSGNAVKLSDGRWQVEFDAADINIPAVCYNTTTLLGVPLPPPLRIDVVPETLKGVIDRETGKVELNFQAKFFFSAGPLYRPPPLIVDTVLTTESTQGVSRGGQGRRLDSDGNCHLVGVARLDPIDDLFLSTFLTLPSDCLASMSARIAFV